MSPAFVGRFAVAGRFAGRDDAFGDDSMRSRAIRRLRVLGGAVVVGLLLALPKPVAVAQDRAADEERLRKAVAQQQRAQAAQLQRAQLRVQGGRVQVVNGRIVGQDGTANAGGIFVRDSAVAGEKLTLAERMEKMREWDTSAEVYQEVLDQYADRVLPIHHDEKGNPDRFGSVTSVVQSRLAKWPEEGRTVYLARYELPARRMLEAASLSNRADLMKIVNRYFITSAGRDAAIILIESYFDHAEFIAAAALCDRLLEEHPQVSGERPLLLTRSALSWSLAGETARAQQSAAQLRERFADASETIGGKTKNLSEIVSAALASPRAAATGPAERSWPVPFGSNDRSAIAGETIDPSAPRIWARLESIPLRQPNLPANLGAAGEVAVQSIQRQRDLGAMTGMIPSVDGTQMFFQDNAGVYGYDLERGQPLLGWLANYPGDGAYRVNAIASPRTVQMTTTLTDRHVLAILGQTDGPSAGASDLKTPVVCLDRMNGTLNWKTLLNEAQTDDETLRAARPCGSVLVVGDSVYVTARSRHNNAFEDTFLVCLSLGDGSLRWSRHLASGNSSSMFYDYNLPSLDGGDSHLAYADGRVFVSTDNGGVACVNAADGSLAWLSVYPRPAPINPQFQWQAINNGTGTFRVKPAFTGNPVIIHQGLAICLPSDAEHLFVFDTVTGEIRGRVVLSHTSDSSGDFVVQPQTFNVLVGVDGDNVILAGSRSIAVLDLKRIVGDVPFARAMVREPRVLAKPGAIDDTIRGRPFLTNSSLYVPTAWKLYRFTPDTSRALEMYPTGGDTWDSRVDEAPGNVIYANDSLIVASPQRVNVYSDLSLLRKRMETAVATDARSILPRLRYADALFNAGQTDESVKWLDSALQQLHTGTLISPGPDRDRVFELASAMFRRLARQAAPEPALASVLERMGRTADTPVQQVGYQLARAHLAARKSDPATVVDAFQTLIADPLVGAIRIRADGGTLSIRELATDAIDQNIKTNGPTAYAAVETRARSALEAARQGNDPPALFAVMDTFPNSQAGRDAMAAAITASMSAKAPSRDLLRRIAADLTDPAQRVQLFETLLRADLAAGEIDAALGRARAIARLDPSRDVADLPAYRSQSFAAGPVNGLIAQLQQLSFAEQDRRLADMNVPDEEPAFSLDALVETKDIATILVPTKPRPDRLVAISRAERLLQVFEPGKPAPIRSIAVSAVPDHAQTQWNGDSLLVTTSSRAAAVDTAAGTTLWTFDPQDLKPASRAQAALLTINAQGLLDPSPASASARGPAVAVSRAQRQAQVQIQRVRQRGLQVDIDQVQLGWTPDEPAPRGRENIAYTRFVGDAVIVATSRGRIIGLDAKSGKVRWQSGFSDRAPSMVGVYNDLFVAGGNDESSSTLIAYRISDGEQMLSQSYNGSIGRRLNTISVSPEGLLAAVHFDSIDVFDLDGGDAGPIATFEGQGQNLFAETTAQERVQFCGDKLLVLIGRAGMPQQVRLYSALTLEPVTVSDEKTKQKIERQFTPSFPGGLRQNEPSARMYVHKDRLLLRGGRHFTVFNVLANDATPWARMDDGSRDTMNSQSPMLVRDGVFIVNWPPDALNGTTASPGFEYYQREAGKDGRESGRVLAEFPLQRKNARMLDRVQPVNGGFYTVWSDGVLCFVPNRKS